MTPSNALAGLSPDLQAQLRELSPEQFDLEVAIGKARRDLGDYMTYVHDLPPAAHHLIWKDLIQATVLPRTGRRRVLFVSPPGHGKTFYGSTALPEWYTGLYPNESLFMGSNSATLAEELLGSVKTTIENSLEYQAVFPHIKPDKVRGWSDSRIFVQRHPKLRSRKDPTIMASGHKAGIVGFRFDGAIIDDPVNEEIAQSDVEMDRVKTFIQRSLFSRMLPNSWMIFILTRWTLDDVASMLLNPDMRFVICQMRALEPDTKANPGGKNVYWYTARPDGTLEERGKVHENGPALWPEWIPEDQRECPRCERQLRTSDPVCPWCLDDGVRSETEQLQEGDSLAHRRMESTTMIWHTMWQGSPGEGELTYIPRRGIRYYCPLCGKIGARPHEVCGCPAFDMDDLRVFARVQRLRLVQAVDPAVTKKKRSDPNVMGTGGIDPKTSDLYLLDVQSLVTNEPQQFIEMVWQLWEPVHVVGIETVAAQVLIATGIRTETLMPVKELLPDSDKDARARGLGIHYRNGKVLHPRAAPWLADFEREIFGVPQVSAWDQVDMMGYLMMLGQSAGRPLQGRGGRVGRVTIGNQRQQVAPARLDKRLQAEQLARVYETYHNTYGVPHPGLAPMPNEGEEEPVNANS